MKELIAFDLLLPNNHIYFFAPRPSSRSSHRPRQTHPKRHKLRGKVRLVTSKPTRLKEVVIKFKGTSSIHLAGSGRRTSHSPGMFTMIGLAEPPMEGQRTLRKTKQVLLSDAVLPAGVTDLGFEISVPGYLPQTHRSDFVNIDYVLSAKVVPAGNFSKAVHTERDVVLQKTMFPKDVCCGAVAGYVVPKHRYVGERRGSIIWQFRVPRVVCLEDPAGLEFEGTFVFGSSESGLANMRTSHGDDDAPNAIDHISVDVVQEELYRMKPKSNDEPENRFEIFVLPEQSSSPRRYIVQPSIPPSTYLRPPPNTTITFSFPLNQVAENRRSFTRPSGHWAGNEEAVQAPGPSGPSLRRHSSIGHIRPRTLLRSQSSIPNLSSLEVSNSAESCFSRTHYVTDGFHHTLDSPFLEIKHYIRVIVQYRQNHRPQSLVLGIPIHVSPNIHPEVVIEREANGEERLPSYSHTVRDGETLPGYAVEDDEDEWEDVPRELTNISASLQHEHADDDGEVDGDEQPQDDNPTYPPDPRPPLEQDSPITGIRTDISRLQPAPSAPQRRKHELNLEVAELAESERDFWRRERCGLMGAHAAEEVGDKDDEVEGGEFRLGSFGGGGRGGERKRKASTPLTPTSYQRATQRKQIQSSNQKSLDDFFNGSTRDKAHDRDIGKSSVEVSQGGGESEDVELNRAIQASLKSEQHAADRTEDGAGNEEMERALRESLDQSIVASQDAQLDEDEELRRAMEESLNEAKRMESVLEYGILDDASEIATLNRQPRNITTIFSETNNGNSTNLSKASLQPENSTATDAPIPDLLVKQPASFRPESHNFTTSHTPYAFLTQAFQQIASHTSRITILNILTNTLRTIWYHNPQDLLPTIWLCSNAIAPPHRGVELGIGPLILSKAITSISGISNKRLKQLYDEHGDWGDVAYAAKVSIRTLVMPRPLTIPNVYSTLASIARLKGNGTVDAKTGLVKKLILAARGEEVRFLVRTFVSHLRIGAVRTTVLIALARAMVYTIPKTQEVDYATLADNTLHALPTDSPSLVSRKLVVAEQLLRAAYARYPDWDGIVNQLHAAGGDIRSIVEGCDVTPGTPVRPMLGKITRDLNAVFEVLDPDRQFACEWKYDGQRAQIHLLESGKVKIYSRHLEDITTKYPDIIELIPSIINANSDGLRTTSFIMDAEVVAVDDEGKRQSFQVLSGRGRKDIVLANVTVNVCVHAFDLMYLNQTSLLSRSFRHRRQLLHTHFTPVAGRFSFVKHMDAKAIPEDMDEVSQFFKDSLQGGCEGIMVKVLDGGKSEQGLVDAYGNQVDALDLETEMAAYLEAEDMDTSILEHNEDQNPSSAKTEVAAKKGRKKELLATYEPDKRLESWLKVKKDYVEGVSDSLDLVPIAGWYGNGRKAGWYSPVLLACYNPETESLESVCKCMSGFSDQFYKDMRVFYGEVSGRICDGPKGYYNVDTKALRPDVWFEPCEVWEIKGAEITISPVHRSAIGKISEDRGLSLRFPRFIKKREDKRIEDATTSDQVAEMYRMQTKDNGELLEDEEE
ncbi:hypothetical protein BZG36_03204 [Bifiguratus adelaidae]|uniref:DNA ligase n=1 Tax=Bifiguratus adelaidae TaxID=1938954 RepID=A0A261Y183_9FUNG|nr:hypothetical protein BZG36_03204 [Bifiguratus adelaidae]